MKSILLLAFFLTLISTTMPERKGKATSPNPGELTFSLTISEDDNIIDIFSLDVENPCSFSLGNFTLTSQQPKTYSILITAYDESKKPCGTKILQDGSLSVTFLTKSGKRFFTKDDKFYDVVKCKPTFCHLSSWSIQNYQISHGNRGEMKIISYNNTNIGDGEELTKLEGGLNAKLQINSSEPFRVTWCYVDNGSDSDNDATIHDIQCSQQKFNTLPFVKINEQPVIFESNSFKVEPFQDSDTVRYTCYIEYCQTEDDYYCRNKNCVHFGTYARTYTKFETILRSNPSRGNRLTISSGIKIQLGLLLFLVFNNL